MPSGGGPGTQVEIKRPVVERAWRLARKQHIFDPEDFALIAVSGGQDSLCLLDVLVTLQPRLQLRLHVAHVNHGLRGKQAAEDAQYVADVAARYKLPFTGLYVDVAAYRRQHGLSTQVAARYARYQALARLARDVGAACVAVGHTRDDQVETLLLNLLRGSGLRGLAGIAPKQELRTDLLGPPMDEGPFRPPATIHLVRPLLDVERRETAAYCEVIGLEPRVDPSNLLPTYLRNRVRLELVPLLEQYNPALRRTLAQTAAALRGDLEVVDLATQAAWERTAHSQPGGIAFSREAFRHELPGIQRQLVREVVARLKGTAEGLSWSTIDAAVRVATGGGPGRRVNLPGGLELVCGYDTFEVRLRVSPHRQSPIPFEPAHLPLPGSVQLGAAGELEARLLETPDEVARARAEALCGQACEAWVDADKLVEPLQVRPRRPGDRLRPLGLGHEKKLQDILVDAKVPRDLRLLVPVVESPRGIVWLAGLRVDERVKLDDTTRRVALLRFKAGSPLAWLCERRR